MLNATATETSDQGSPSSVHTLGTTPQVQATTADSQGTLQKAARAAWLADVRVHAHPKLTKLSMVHARKGQKAYARQRQLILEGREAERRGKVAKATKLAEAAMRPESYRAWHMNRAKGLFQRFERVTGCGQDFVQATCRGCTGQRDRTPMRCGVVSLCPHCRGRRARLLRARFEVGRRRALQNAGRAGFTSRFRSARYGGAMAERFATFTIPHAPGESAAVSMTRLRKAWSIFAPKLLRYLREYCSKPNDREDVGRIAARVRVIEATTGTLGEGHPHIHVWLLTPFIPRVWLVHAWGEALSRAGAPAPVRSRSSAIMEALRPFVNGREITNPLAFKSELTRLRKLFRTRKGKNGRPLREVYSPIVDLRKVKDGAGSELVKYLVKDATRATDGSLQFAEPSSMAELVVAYVGVRAWQASRGLTRKSKVGCACQECGLVGEWNVRRVEHPSASPNAPPSTGT